MKFDLDKSIEILRRTPLVIESLFYEISDEWLSGNEGTNTWNPYDILGHLIHGEKTDWIQRSKIILSELDDKTFIPFDRFAQMNISQPDPVEKLISEFKELRNRNLDELKSFQINDSKLSMKGIHPDLGEVRLRELLSAWVVHDLGHISQITRVMAKQYKNEVGPFINYLSILKDK